MRSHESTEYRYLKRASVLKVQIPTTHTEAGARLHAVRSVLSNVFASTVGNVREGSEITDRHLSHASNIGRSSRSRSA